MKPTLRTLKRGALLGMLSLTLAACGGGKEVASDKSEAPTASGADETRAVSSEVSAMTTEQLREAATRAIAEQRLYAPAGNNAMEYYLALRDKGPNDVAVSSVLADLQPYTLIATEQAITRDDFAEAKRLYALLEKTDPNAPALQRLKTGIADAENTLAQRQQQSTEADEARRRELEKKRLEEQQRMQQQASQQLAARQAEEKRLADLRAAEEQRQEAQAAREAEERRQAEQRAAVQRQAEQRASAQAVAAEAPAPAPAAPPVVRRANTELRPISAPQPRYPTEALRNNLSGSVQVEFTVGTNGSVSAVRVINANPPRVFNNEVLNTVRRWRFQPLDEPVTSRRTFTFNPEQ